MNTIAENLESKFRSSSIDIEQYAIQKDQDYENETTYWIFSDGSALGLCSDNVVYVKNEYGLSADNEQIK